MRIKDILNEDEVGHDIPSNVPPWSGASKVSRQGRKSMPTLLSSKPQTPIKKDRSWIRKRLKERIAESSGKGLKSRSPTFIDGKQLAVRPFLEVGHATMLHDALRLVPQKICFNVQCGRA